MFISGLSQSYLVVYGALTLIWVTVFALFTTLIATDMGWDIDEDDYLAVARGTGIAGLAASAFYLGILILNGLSRVENTGITFNWDIAWVAPTTTALGTMLITSSTIKSPASVWHGVGKLLAKPLGRWCALLERLTRNG